MPRLVLLLLFGLATAIGGCASDHLTDAEWARRRVERDRGLVAAVVSWAGNGIGARSRVDIAIWESGLIVWRPPEGEGYVYAWLEQDQTQELRAMLADSRLAHAPEHQKVALCSSSTEVRMGVDGKTRRYAWAEWLMEVRDPPRSPEDIALYSDWSDAKQIILWMAPCCGRSIETDATARAEFDRSFPGFREVGAWDFDMP